MREDCVLTCQPFPVAPGSCCSGWLGAHSSSACAFQFPDIVEFSETMANAGKTVIVAALDGTFQRKVSLAGTSEQGDRQPRASSVSAGCSLDAQPSSLACRV